MLKIIVFIGCILLFMCGFRVGTVFNYPTQLLQRLFYGTTKQQNILLYEDDKVIVTVDISDIDKDNKQEYIENFSSYLDNYIEDFKKES